jgi:hypothetical protein
MRIRRIDGIFSAAPLDRSGDILLHVLDCDTLKLVLVVTVNYTRIRESRNRKAGNIAQRFLVAE